MSNMLRLAMVGLGIQGTRLIDSVHGKSRDVIVKMGVTIDSAEAAGARARYGFPVHDRLEAALADPDIDAVVLATPPMLHFEQTCAAARAGKHVLCEKPFTFSLGQAADAISACLRGGVKLAVAYTHRLHPPMLELARLVRGGALGTILYAEGNYSHDLSPPYDPKSWRALPEASPGKARFFAANTVHALDALIGLFGRVSGIYAQGTHRAFPADLLDVTSLNLTFVTGLSAGLVGIDGTPFIWRIQVYGTKGWAEVRDFRVLTVHADKRTVTTEYPLTPVLRTGLEAFAAAVQGGPDYPVSTPEVVYGIEAFEGMVQSLETRSSVSIVDASGERRS
jgi:predicted dehydrogenase